MGISDLLSLYDEKVRGWTGVPSPGFRIERDGPVVRLVGSAPEAHSNAILLTQLSDDTADEIIARQVGFFEELGHAFEWKHFSHDRPADLPDRLRAAGFVPQEPETLVAFDVVQGLDASPLPATVRIEHLEDPASFGAIAEAISAVYGDPQHADWLAGSIADEKRADPDSIQVYAALAGDKTVSIGWFRHKRGDAFGSLWGGATLPEWRGKGVYTALVAIRAQQARQRGCRWLTVDCSPMSLPILERRGFQRLAVTTPFIWSPHSTLSQP